MLTHVEWLALFQRCAFEMKGGCIELECSVVACNNAVSKL